MQNLLKFDSYASVDVETANFDQGSICSIGIAVYRNGKLSHTWYSLVNPDCDFDPQNVAIHGIQKADVVDAPKLKDLAGIIWRALDDTVLVCHTAFDKTAFRKVSMKYKVKLPRSIWLDSSMVARRTWSQFSKRGYGLKNVCDFIGHKFGHHNALEDAIACGKVVSVAMLETGKSFSEILDNCYGGNWKEDFSNMPVSRDPDALGPLTSEIFVITGELKLGRTQVAKQLAQLGGKVSDSISKKTTVLVVGDQSGAQLDYVSEKLKRALEMQKDGFPISIIDEFELMSIFEDYKAKM